MKYNNFLVLIFTIVSFVPLLSQINEDKALIKSGRNRFDFSQDQEEKYRDICNKIDSINYLNSKILSSIDSIKDFKVREKVLINYMSNYNDNFKSNIEKMIKYSSIHGMLIPYNWYNKGEYRLAAILDSNLIKVVLINMIGSELINTCDFIKNNKELLFTIGVYADNEVISRFKYAFKLSSGCKKDNLELILKEFNKKKHK